LEFNIPAENDTYKFTNIELYVSGKLTTADGKDLNAEDFNVVAKYFLHSIFSHFTIYLNGVPITIVTALHLSHDTGDTALLWKRRDPFASHQRFLVPFTRETCCPVAPLRSP
jgi:hypothetical protein